MKLSDVIAIEAGTSEGAQKAWDTRGRGRKEQEKKGRPEPKNNPDPAGNVERQKVQQIKQKGVGKPKQAQAPQLSDRAMKAKENYVPITKEKYGIAMQFQQKFADSIGGQVVTDNAPFDVVKGKTAFEVKTIQNSKKDRIEMRPDSKAKKLSAIRKLKMQAYTIGFDIRQGKEAIYIRKGVGAFRFGSMTKIKTMDDLKSFIKFK